MTFFPHQFFIELGKIIIIEVIAITESLPPNETPTTELTAWPSVHMRAQSTTITVPVVNRQVQITNRTFHIVELTQDARTLSQARIR